MSFLMTLGLIIFPVAAAIGSLMFIGLFAELEKRKSKTLNMMTTSWYESDNHSPMKDAEIFVAHKLQRDQSEVGRQ